MMDCICLFFFNYSVILQDFYKSGLIGNEVPQLKFEQVPFNHPMFIMYSSGTTGAPKCMVHSVGVSILLLNSTTESQLLTTLGKKTFENIVEKGENAGNQHFLLFPQCLYPSQKQISISHLFCHLQRI